MAGPGDGALTEPLDRPAEPVRALEGDTAADVMAALRQQFDDLPQQLQTAALFILERPQDVALMSMREQAIAAGVSHSTMMRLAEWLGLGGYAALREAFARSFRENAGGGPAEATTSDLSGDTATSSTIAAAIAQLAEGGIRPQLSAAALCLMKAKRILCIGSHEAAPVVRHATRLFRALGADVTALEGTAFFGPFSSMLRVPSGCCVIGISLEPHGEYPVEAMRFAVARGLPSIAIADDATAAVARMAGIPIVVAPVEIAPGIPSLTAAMAAVEAISTIWEERAAA